MKQTKLYTPVEAVEPGFSISHSDRLMLIGSCFTENMGHRLTEAGFGTMINPFGILYNPLSLATAMSYCLDDRKIGECDLVNRDGLWHSWLHHGSFSRPDMQDCLDACNESTHRAHLFLNECNTVVVTFGSAWYYVLKEGATVVGNCHKVPAAMFEKRLATVEEVVDTWRPLVERMTERGMRIVFTVSPVRHQAYGAHGNQLGKAVLLLAVERLLSDSGGNLVNCTYFPAFEIIVDELRDYRFYADDLSHPSALAEQIVWQRFQQTFMTEATIAACDEADRELRRSAHRQLH